MISVSGKKWIEQSVNKKIVEKIWEHKIGGLKSQTRHITVFARSSLMKTRYFSTNLSKTLSKMNGF